eukprot:7492345-Alexandrium_andersonii.AAC.1
MAVGHVWSCASGELTGGTEFRSCRPRVEHGWSMVGVCAIPGFRTPQSLLQSADSDPARTTAQ